MPDPFAFHNLNGVHSSNDNNDYYYGSLTMALMKERAWWLRKKTKSSVGVYLLCMDLSALSVWCVRRSFHMFKCFKYYFRQRICVRIRLEKIKWPYILTTNFSHALSSWYILCEIPPFFSYKKNLSQTALISNIITKNRINWKNAT